MVQQKHADSCDQLKNILLSAPFFPQRDHNLYMMVLKALYLYIIFNRGFTMRTRSTPVAEAIENRKWWVVDLEGQTLGRAASQIAHILRGKHKPTFTPHINDGDYVIVVNAGKVNLTGKKWNDKMYYRH